MHNPLPPQFLARLERIVLTSDLEKVLTSLTIRRPTTLRVNTLKTTGEQLQKELKQQGVELTPVFWWNQAFIVDDTSLKILTGFDLYKNGFFYVQSLSSMLPPLILGPLSGEKVLDITAAPGSKTTQMAALMNNTGEIVANDSSPIRLLKLQANLKIQGVTNTRVVKGAGQVLWQVYPEYFDKTLVDVPCSMEGRMTSLDNKSYEHWSTAKIKELTQEQRFLMRSAISATKPGGTIVYSTCTLAPEENEGIIDWILKKEKGAVVVEEIKIPRLETSSAVLEWNSKKFDDSISKTIRVLPSLTMEGFYVAKLRKMKSTIPQSMKTVDGR